MRLKSIQPYCPACGFELIKGTQQTSRSQASAQSSSYGRPLNTELPINTGKAADQYSVISNDSADQFSFSEFIGMKKYFGTVIALEQPYMAKRETSLPMFLLKAALWICFFPIILGVILGLVIASKMFSFLTPGRSDRPGFFSTLASQVVGFFLTGKLFGPKDLIPVRDLRLRDKNGLEYLVRIRGELYAGNVNGGDEIEVEGFNRRGTIEFLRGRNLRTRSEILVKKQ
ncbi:MAG: hypothetical protein V1762_03555 [Nitrospirota bacterium]